MQSMSDGLWRKKLSRQEESSYPNSVPARLCPSPKSLNSDSNSDSYYYIVIMECGILLSRRNLTPCYVLLVTMECGILLSRRNDTFDKKYTTYKQLNTYYLDRLHK